MISTADMDRLMEADTVLVTEQNPYGVFQDESSATVDIDSFEGDLSPDDAAKALLGAETMAAFRLCLVEHESAVQQSNLSHVELVSDGDRDFLKSWESLYVCLEEASETERLEEDERARKRMRLMNPDVVVSEIAPGSEVFRRYFTSTFHRQIVEEVLA
ncbi:hypothetical protein B0H11DRAFT_2241328 [Mycena galericulata]|nr:hypothetical protein B0H11DRAFT_2241328 [Mycena galericulata]